GSFEVRDACDAPPLAGTALAAAPSRLVDDDGKRRTDTFRFDAATFQGGAIDLCASVGEILVEPTNGTTVELQWIVQGHSQRVVEETHVAAQLRNDGGRLVIGAWESQIGREGGWFGGDGADTRLVVRLPETGAYAMTIATDVGDVHVSGLRVSALAASSDVGNVIVLDTDLEGDAKGRADVGDVIFHFGSVQSGNISAIVDVGNADVELPQRADVGYDATADAGVGEAVVRLGETESYDAKEDAPGGHVEARSMGFATKPTRIVVRAGSDVGDARIVAS
ncbi:MAG TPA: hypothetical protein VM370_12305, partial [Candidatus Thermoplasmatota archaeon]|nr:hypothetical protein [Candidatus Thermoplasmatota archaeon]